MRATQEQVERFDAENGVLGDPVEVPTVRKVEAKTGKERKEPAVTYGFFLRAPRGVRATADPDPENGQAFHYPGIGSPRGSQGRVNVAVSPTGVTDLYLAFGVDLAPVWADKVAAAFSHGVGPIQRGKRDVDVHGEEPRLSFETRDFSDDAGGEWSVNAVTRDGKTVAVVFRIEKGKRPNADKAIEMSLATLAIGPEVEFVKKSYARRGR